jgi:polar amino acid transport system permease protein
VQEATKKKRFKGKNQTMSGIFAAFSAAVASLGATIDPWCGPIGVFRLFAGNTLLACGDAGWGDEIGYGFLVTASLAIATLPVGLAIGFVIALGKQSREKSLRLSADIYTTIFRGLPELLTLFIVYYGLQIVAQKVLAAAGYTGAVEIDAFFAGMIALGVVFSAYCSEVLQSAFKAIPNGQYEAGDALGFSRSKTMRLIVLPQLFRIALPGLGNLWMALLKDTALVSVIGLPDILRQTGVAARVTKQAFEFFGLACLLFLLLAAASSIVFSALERWAHRSEVAR